MFFDSHCHLTSEALSPYFPSVLTRARAAGVTHLLNIADSIETAREAAVQTQAAPGHDMKMWATAGIHPQNAVQWNDATMDELRTLAVLPEVVAIGEIGLDFVYDETHAQFPGTSRLVQEDVLCLQLQLALECKLPVVLHNRDADADILRIVAEYPDLRGVLHCFGSPVKVAQEALSLGFSLGFTGLITFKNAGDVREAARICPLDRLLIETDSPYLAPVPHRGKTNEPSYLPYVAATIAELHGVTVEEIGRITSANAMRLFGFA